MSRNSRRAARIAFIALLAFDGRADAQRIVEQRIEPSSGATIGDRLALVLVVETTRSAKPQAAIPNESGNERVWGEPTVERIRRQSATAHWTIRAPFQIFRVGDVAVPPLDVAVDGAVLSSEPATVTVRAVRDGDDADVLRDARPPVGLPGYPWVWLAVGASLASGAFLALRKRRPRPEAADSGPVPTPDEWLDAEFARLRAMPVDNEEALRFLVASTADVVRGYLERKAGVPAPSRTTRGALDALGSTLSRETRHRLEQTLQAADFVKFAGHAPIAEVARRYVQHARETVDAVNDELARTPAADASAARDSHAEIA